MANESKITTLLEVDDALVQDANYQFDSNDRQYIDNQSLGAQQHLVDALIRGKHATYVKVDAASASLAAGDVVCLASTASGRITKATPSALANAKAVFGVMLRAAAPNTEGLVAIGGAVSPSVTGLAASSGFVRVSASGRCERVSSISGSDYAVGVVDGAGWTNIAVSVGGGSGANLDTTNSTLSQSSYQCETSDATPYSVPSATVALSTDTTTTVDVEARCIQTGASKTKVFNIRRHFLNDGGTVTASTQETVSGPDEVGGALTADVNINYTGTTARVDVTGVAATTLRWRVDLQSVQLTAGGVVPNLVSISPSSGVAAGGTSVTLSGSGFTGATGATVGGVALTSFTVVNDTTITGVTGAHALGAVDVVVTGPGGSDTLAGGYTYADAWTPASLGADLIAWYRADLGVTGTSPVTAWADQSANGHNMTAGGNPVLTAVDADFNNQASITLDGTGDYFQSTVFGATESVPFTVVMVFKQTGGTYLFDGIAAGFRAGIFNNSGDLSALHQASSTYMASGVAPSGAKQFMMAEFSADTVNSSMAVGQLTPQATYSTGVGSSGLTGITVGDYYGAAAPMIGDVAEVIVIGKLLSGGEKTSLASYVNTRYSMAIA